MRSKRGEVCFFVAASVEHVRALSREQRKLEEQAEQFVVLDLGAGRFEEGVGEMPGGGGGGLEQPFDVDAGHAFGVLGGGGTASLAKALGLQVKRSLMAFGEGEAEMERQV